MDEDNKGSNYILVDFSYSNVLSMDEDDKNSKLVLMDLHVIICFQQMRFRNIVIKS